MEYVSPDPHELEIGYVSPELERRAHYIPRWGRGSVARSWKSSPMRRLLLTQLRPTNAFASCVPGNRLRR